MGFDLGLAAAAYQGVKAEQRRLREDEFAQAQHDYQRARMDEYAGNRGLRDNSASLQDETITAQRAQLPKRMQVQTGALDAQAADQAFAEQRRPGLQEATLKTDEANGVKAGASVSKAKDFKDWADYEHEANAQRIDEAIAGDATKAEKMRGDVYAAIWKGGALDKDEPHDLVERFNSVSKSKTLFPWLDGQKVADIKRKDGKVQLYDEDGDVIKTIPVAKLKAAYDERHPAQFEKLNDGQNIVRRNPDGSVTQLTDNVKHFRPASAGGGAGLGGAPKSSGPERMIAALQAEAKSKGQDLSYNDALSIVKANPGQGGIALLKSNQNYQMERDPNKRREMEAEARNAAYGMVQPQARAAPGQPSAGLGALSPKSQSAILDAIKPGL